VGHCLGARISVKKHLLPDLHDELPLEGVVVFVDRLRTLLVFDELEVGLGGPPFGVEPQRLPKALSRLDRASLR
jgi:hypothetical protein